MPNKDRNIPKRRFKEFENADAWELRKFGEVVYRSNLISSSKDLPRLEFEDINSGLGTLNKDISQKLDYRKGLEFNVGDVLFGKLRPYLKNWWYAEFKGIALGDFWNLKSDLWHSCFLYTYIQSNSFQLVANDTSGTKMPRSDWNLVAESIAKFPSLPEQEAIGTFFSTLDQHITLHQRKLDKLKSVKQAYLSEMFPAEGERVPKRRFPGFTDAWELRKLGEVMEVTSVKRIHQSDWTDFGVRFLRARDIVAESKNESVSEPLFISQKKYDEYTAISGKVTKGDLLVTGVGTIGIPMLIEKNEPIYFKDGNIIWFKNENHIDGQFFYYSFIGKNIQSFIKESAGIGTVGTFTINTGKNTPIDLPILKKEQEAIGTFFSTLDQHITLHQRKS